MHCANSAPAPRLRSGTLLLLLLLAVPPAEAQPPADRDLDRIRGEITRMRERLEDVRRRARTAEEELEATDIELNIRSRELAIALDLQTGLQREQAAVEQQILRLQQRIATQKEYLSRRLAGMYRLGGLSYLRMFLSLNQQRDPSAGVAMLSFLVTHDGRMIQRFQESRRQLAARSADLVQRQRKLTEVARGIDQQRRAIQATLLAKQRLLERLRSEESGSEQQIAALEEKARRLERLVTLLSRQAGAMIPELDVRTFRGALGWPVEGRVIEQFGRQRNAKFATYTMNNGLRIAAAPHTPVRAVFQGTVLFSQWFKGYGNLIIVDHGNRVFSLYGNVNGPAVIVGDRITTGQAIAGVGESEDGQAGHLYFEIREDNKPEDPQKWLR